tara:strand:+ start:300 stop:659 length:360 start_codon:yes stop_codon:yes gene_type:complete
MIQVNELRIGNWVKYQFHDRLKKVKICSNDFKILDDKNTNDYKERYSPIPLTEQWLIDFGAKEWKHIRYKTFKLGILMIGSTDNMKSFEIVDLYMKPIKYVHQLQNLYFSLTGEELNKQ